MKNVVIIGGGMVGLAQAIALAEKGIGVTVIDHEDPARIIQAEFDGRVSAIAWRSYKFLEKIGAWKWMAPHAEAIKDIRVSEFGSSLFLHFDHQEIGTDPFGYIIENRHTRGALYNRAAELPNIKLIAPARVTKFDFENYAIEVEHNYQASTINYQLLIGADGKNSQLRKALGIGEFRKSYKQSGIVCTISHEKPHQGLAHEHFMPVGPFAVLPMAGVEGDPNRSSIVWTEPTELASIYMGMSDDEFLAQVRKRVDYLGNVKIFGKKWVYPLELMHADQYAKGNAILIGDAAHSIHPIAGQGVNLGFRDAETLSDLIYERMKLGLTPSLSDYENHRRFDNNLMINATDKLNILFSNNILPIKLARTAGLGLVNQIPPLRRVFMKYAAGKIKMG